MMEGDATPRRYLFANADEVLHFLNPYGRFQWIINALLSVAYSAALLHVIIPYFLSMEPSWVCAPNSTVCRYNSTAAVTDEERCNIPRTEWQYSEPIEYSIVSQFDLTCDRAWLNYMSTSAVYIGLALGALVIGYISDKCGRRFVVIPALALVFVVAILSVFSPNISTFIFARFIIGLLMSGAPVMHILMGELVDTKHRPLGSAIMYAAHAFSWIILGGTAYFVRRWKYLLIAATIPYTFVIGFYKFIPESIHWLHLHNLKDELNDVLKRMAYWNKVKLPDNDTCDYLPSGKRERSVSGIMETIITRVPLKKTVNLSCGWFVVVMLYFGLSLGADDFGGSVYVSFILISVIEVPANVFVHYSNRYFGRKPTVCVSMISAGAACILVIFIPTVGRLSLLRLGVGVLGKACITVTYNSLEIWSLELYPTESRACGMGILTFMGRCGGASTSWIVKGLKIVDDKLPYSIMGISATVCGLFFLLLPETKHVVTSELGRTTVNSYGTMDEGTYSL